MMDVFSTWPTLQYDLYKQKLANNQEMKVICDQMHMFVVQR